MLLWLVETEVKIVSRLAYWRTAFKFGIIIALGNFAFDMKNIHKQKRTAEDFQMAIFKKMPFSKKLRLASKLSDFLLNLNKLNKENGISRIAEKNR